MATIQLEIKNGNNHDNFVTLRDRNQAGAPVLAGWNKKRLNGNDSGMATVQADGTGLGKVTWTATRADDASETKTANDEQYDGGTVFVSSY